MLKNAKICPKAGDGTTSADLAHRGKMEKRGESEGANIRALHLIGVKSHHRGDCWGVKRANKIVYRLN